MQGSLLMHIHTSAPAGLFWLYHRRGTFPQKKCAQFHQLFQDVCMPPCIARHHHGAALQLQEHATIVFSLTDMMWKTPQSPKT
eukprot:3794442-Amphidinium_carterae.1